MPYTCNYSGECEPDPNGRYNTEAECLIHCTGRENKELMYLVHEYDPASALDLAPSDQVAVLKRLTGILLEPVDARRILEAIIANDYELLALVEDILPWIRSRHPFSLVFELPVGSLTPQEIIDFHLYTDQEITQLVVREGVNLNTLRRGDVIRIMDIPFLQGRFVAYNSATLLVERTAYLTYRLGSSFAINWFPRVDYFRYSLPGNDVVVVKSRLPPLTLDMGRRISSQIWVVDIGPYHIYTRDLAKLREDWAKPPPIIRLYYLSPWGDAEGRGHDLYTEPV